ncbi:hypothetical protein P4H70_14960 [Paenibacillus ehimensis]|uniref:hypothetical protein n=1 Tax=Paenibacillus ehimensis TaxID=79264 RepID=UPI002DBE31E6|nr:hypothetical protein [Paenibacillus ehimensis]MEC0210236.1 hypothetical protein [Paenibacillus ehimensis]
MYDRIRLFLGKPACVNNINIYSPTIDGIAEIGEVVYNIYITLASFNKEVILKTLFGINDENYSLIENEDTFDILTSIPAVVHETEKAFSFFTKADVKYDLTSSSFMAEDVIFVNKHNYLEVSEIIKKLNGMSIDENKPIKFKNEKAKKLHEKLQQLKKKYQKSDADSLDLKDMLSILCNADGNGIDVFNVGKLTVYQVYEHFERLNMKEQHKRLLKVWANGYLGSDDKLPEWIIKSKL